MDRQHQKTEEGVGVDEVEISIVIHQVGGSATQEEWLDPTLWIP